MADAAPEPKPIDNLENLDLLQTDLIAYIAKETGINMFEHDSTEVPAFTAADIKWSPMSVLSHAFSKSLSTNILEGKSSHMYPAVVLIPFKSGPGGVQSCKAIAPHVHASAENPFSVTDDADRAEMMSHFPTFSFNDGLSEASSPIVPGSIILVSFDNPHNYWSSGVVEKVVVGRPDTMPQWATAIESIKSIFDDPAAWVTGFLLGVNQADDGTFTYNDNAGTTSATTALSPAQSNSSGEANASVGMLEFLSEMAKHAQQQGLPVPVVTSTYRDNAAQARAMANNWYQQGGSTNWSASSAQSYITKLYGANWGGKYHAAFLTGHVKGKVNDAGQAACVAVLDDKGAGSSHSSNPATAVDLRMQHTIDQLFASFTGVQPSQTVMGSVNFSWTSADSTTYSGKILSEKDHRHMELK